MSGSLPCSIIFRAFVLALCNYILYIHIVMTTTQTNNTGDKTKMNALSKVSQRIFDKLIVGLDADGKARKIDTSGYAMAVHVDRLRTTPAGTVYAVAHYFRQNGDAMADPDMTFLLASTDGRAYPITFRQDGGIPMNQNAVVWSDRGTITAVRPRIQREITTFANQWLRNIKNQQRAI